MTKVIAERYLNSSGKQRLLELGQNARTLKVSSPVLPACSDQSRARSGECASRIHSGGRSFHGPLKSLAKVLLLLKRSIQKCMFCSFTIQCNVILNGLSTRSLVGSISFYCRETHCTCRACISPSPKGSFRQHLFGPFPRRVLGRINVDLCE